MKNRVTNYTLLLLFVNSILLAEIKLPAIFSDGMVLQQKQEVPVWGWAAEGTQVELTFNGQSKTAISDASGKWMLTLDALQASSVGQEMKLTVGDETRIIKDVLVGEVWLCSGQSNMDFKMELLAKPAKSIQYRTASSYIKEEIAKANDPLFRQILVKRNPSPLEVQTEFTGEWKSSNPENTKLFTATGYFFGRELREKLNVPVALIKSAWGGTRVEPWIPELGYRSEPSMAIFFDKRLQRLKDNLAKYDPVKAKALHEAALKEWKDNGKQGRAPRKPVHPALNHRSPAALYNGMINPLVPYAIKGVIWYQGEANIRGKVEEYELYFSTLINTWRKIWKQGDFPFYYVQLANFRDVNENPLDEDPWSSIQDQQRRVLKLPNTGMAVINDIGEANDIHPRNKIDVGKRLASWALTKDYGQAATAYSGPLYKSHTIEGDKVIITFDHIGSGLMVGEKDVLNPTVPVDEPLARFQICGADRKWVWGNAKIINANQVEVSHPEIKEPTIVRYAWSSNPEGANLYNKEGFPASLFTTEK